MLEDMKRARGFTLIEMLVTITVMVVLMTLAVVNIRNSQMQARDKEREADATNIVRQLDSLYTRGWPSPMTTARGSYPTTDVLTANIGVIFKDLPPATVRAPGWTIPSIGVADTALVGLSVTPSPSATTQDDAAAMAYIYQPLTSVGTLCTTAAASECRQFNLYYKKEVNGQVVMLRSANR